MRRQFLFLAATAPALLVAPGLAHAAARRRASPPLAQRRLELRHAATGARFEGPYHNGVDFDAGAMRELSIVLADTRTGTVRPFDPKAIDILWEVGARERMASFNVLSGYRTPASNAAVHGAGDSQHMRAAALDVQVPKAKLASFGHAALALGRGGVGSYPDHGFVHVDSGPVRSWGFDRAAGVARAPARTPEQIRLDRMAEAWAQTRRR
ncbi:twin-arginine translocation pathway signal protein [Pseudoroseomonas rhizosphaerae]|uniref:Murein endopeptidase K n=1 Tax=Teichococcus rhizosphaerae TaxID=1335062 RepID=A0A2C6ZC86_9PROT|nr:DUF882 domain-containing protein [Pseudoroseomonas rhizosphaerae]PHK96101.1 twin-arginine translocation pathway signal protein [Pseudoroseomonas rhizosphaerae]